MAVLVPIPARPRARGTACPCGTLIEMLAYRAAVQPDERAYTFLENGEEASATLTWRELERKSRAIAALMQTRLSPGERAILFYPPGLDFVAAFFGCVAAGVIAVPVQPPQGRHAEGREERLRAIMADAGARVTLTSGALPERHWRDVPLSEPADGTARDNWILTDDIPDGRAAEWRDPRVAAGATAFLQYTSGSTTRPRGVMVSHGNVMHNLAAAFQLGETTSDTVSVSWLPPTHDMGLIEGLLQPAFSGCPAYLMSPGAFLQRPVRWLRAISRYGATRSGGPNFAYDLAVDRIAPADRATLDLRTWTAAYNGAEPVREDTLERFAAAFEPAGFSRTAFRPSYGLAESTLLVATRRWQPGAAVDGVVSCGTPPPGTRVAIVDPVTDRTCADGEIGEIRVAGPGVAQGYWNHPDETMRTFGSRVEGTTSPWLRTGDLGFSRDGDLHVTGRMKDLLIVRGVKHFPQDLERTAERVHPAVRPGAVVAVAVSTTARGDHVVLIAEIDLRRLEAESTWPLIAAMRQAVATVHGIQLHGVALVRPRTVPKTPSGKLRRFLCGEAWLAGSLDVIALWRDPGSARPAPGRLD